MRLDQLFLALTLVPAVQMSAVAQITLHSVSIFAGEPLSQLFLIETVKANVPEASADTGAPATPADAVPAPVPTPLHLTPKSKWFEDAYEDAYRILKAENPCSDFFGGAAKATEVLNQLVEQFKQKHYDNSALAIHMSGHYTQVVNAQTGASYRLFDQVMVNTNGPLVTPQVITSFHPQWFGHFRSDTRAARALILLHEIGHLVTGDDGRWLLPNDGNDAALSARNTGRVEGYCFKQLAPLK